MVIKKSRFTKKIDINRKNIPILYTFNDIFLIKDLFIHLLKFYDINEICGFEKIQKKFLFFIRDYKNKLIWKEKVKYYNFDRYNEINKLPINLNICWRSEFKEIYLNTSFIRYNYYYKGGCYKHLHKGVYNIFPHGIGIGKFLDGSIYEGEWKYGNFYRVFCGINSFLKISLKTKTF